LGAWYCGLKNAGCLFQVFNEKLAIAKMNEMLSVVFDMRADGEMESEHFLPFKVFPYFHCGVTTPAVVVGGGAQNH